MPAGERDGRESLGRGLKINVTRQGQLMSAVPLLILDGRVEVENVLVYLNRAGFEFGEGALELFYV